MNRVRFMCAYEKPSSREVCFWQPGWSGNVSGSLEKNLTRALQQVQPEDTYPLATKWHVWMGEVRGGATPGRQFNVGTRKPRPICSDDIIGDRIFSGTFDEAWATFETYVRLL